MTRSESALMKTPRGSDPKMLYLRLVSGSIPPKDRYFWGGTWSFLPRKWSKWTISLENLRYQPKSSKFGRQSQKWGQNEVPQNRQITQVLTSLATQSIFEHIPVLKNSIFMTSICRFLQGSFKRQNRVHFRIHLPLNKTYPKSKRKKIIELWKRLRKA